MTTLATLSNACLDARLASAIEACRLAGDETSEELDALFEERAARIAKALAALAVTNAIELPRARKPARRYSKLPSQDRYIRTLLTANACDEAIAYALDRARNGSKSRAYTFRALAAGVEVRRAELASGA